MKLRKTVCALLCCLFLLGLAPTARAAGLTATVASGPVVLNGWTVDNATAEYPLLVYKDITYFPMTYHLCRLLGLTTKWDGAAKTLTITKTGEMGEYVPDTGHSRKSGSVSVTKVDYPVVVNGETVDNNAEWPLLNYNNVTYFPLTWAFAVDAFGWDYSWSAKYGLDINSTGLAIYQTTSGANMAWGSLASMTPPVIEFTLSGEWTMEKILAGILTNLKAELRGDGALGAESADHLVGIKPDPNFQLPADLRAGQVVTVTFTACYLADPVIVANMGLFYPTSEMAGVTAQVTLAE